MKIKSCIVLIIYILTTHSLLSQNKEVLLQYKSNTTKKADSTRIIQLNHSTTPHKITDSLKSQLKNQGYLNLLISEPKRITNNISKVTINLNRKYTHIKYFFNIKNKQDSLIMHSLSRKRENIITIKDQKKIIDDYNEQLKEMGYPFNEIKLSNIKLNDSDTITANLNFKIIEKRYIDNIILKGYTNFPKTTISSFNNKTRNYNEKTIKEIDEIIKNIPFAKQTKKTEVLFKKDSTNIYVYLEKINTNTAEGLLGFNNTTDGKLELNGYIDLKLQNNLNRAETFILQYRNDNGDQTNFQTSINLPYVWKTPIGINTELDIQRRDSTYQSTSFSTGLFYKPNWKTSLGLNYKSVTSNATATDTDLENYTKNGVELTSNYQQNTTDPLMPENFYLKANFGLIKRTGIEINEKQLSFNATFLKLWHLSHRSVFLSNITSYYLKSNNIQFNELYQFGGLGSIRGFNQNSIDSSFYTTLATEYRYRLNDQIYLHTILDIGVFENFNSKNLDKLYGFGGGIAILTQAGILNLSIANGRFEDAKVDLSSTIAHISLKINF
ncbi:hypothetical protein [Nonlabens sp. Asnod3-A02]|uniref:hypothetical protein n=1 Tax=Nonlabens sp. Asnod3-A02 TaxID=3160579 RepID=UPI0038661148